MNPIHVNCNNIKSVTYKDMCKKLTRHDYKYANMGEVLTGLMEGHPSSFQKDKIEKTLTKNKNVDMEIHQRVDDKNLANICLTNKYVYSLCQDENFLEKPFY